VNSFCGADRWGAVGSAQAFCTQRCRGRGCPRPQTLRAKHARGHPAFPTVGRSRRDRRRGAPRSRVFLQKRCAGLGARTAPSAGKPRRRSRRDRPTGRDARSPQLLRRAQSGAQAFCTQRCRGRGRPRPQTLRAKHARGHPALPVGTPAVHNSCAVRSRERASLLHPTLSRTGPSARPDAPRKTRTRTSRLSDGRAVSPRPPLRRAAIPRFLAKKMRRAGGADGPVRGKGLQPVHPSALRVGEKRAGVRPDGGLGETALPVGTPAVHNSCAERSRERGRGRPRESPDGGLGETALPVGTPAVHNSCAVRSRARGRPRPQQRVV